MSLENLHGGLWVAALAAGGEELPAGYEVPPWWSFLPFVLLLLSIAILPLIQRLHHWWERNSSKLLVASILGALTILYYGLVQPGVIGHGAGHEAIFIPKGLDAVKHVLEHAIIKDYIPFIILLFSLYTISGGIYVRGDLPAHPLTNTAFLGIGAVLASFIGTTGASMLLIRPILRTNQERRLVAHTVIFFIFIVSNVGGLLTPLGDPPLFLGYLRGVPFWWTMQLLPEWAMVVAFLLIGYYIFDSFAYRAEGRREIARDEAMVEKIGIDGKINFVWLLGVVACVALLDPSRPVPGTDWRPPVFFREGILVLLTGISWFCTPDNQGIRRMNHFNFAAIGEVACLFIGIFICMQPPVEFLQVKGASLGLESAKGFFWATGSLSSFLDNAPTYVVFFETARSLLAQAEGDLQSLLQAGKLVALTTREGTSYIQLDLLVAISLGSVFMGAMTYIGNGPNFMVKSIAESRKVKMPSFFGFLLWSIVVLGPTFYLMTWWFL